MSTSTPQKPATRPSQIAEHLLLPIPEKEGPAVDPADHMVANWQILCPEYGGLSAPSVESSAFSTSPPPCTHKTKHKQKPGFYFRARNPTNSKSTTERGSA